MSSCSFTKGMSESLREVSASEKVAFKVRLEKESQSVWGGRGTPGQTQRGGGTERWACAALREGKVGGRDTDEEVENREWIM